MNIDKAFKQSSFDGNCWLGRATLEGKEAGEILEAAISRQMEVKVRDGNFEIVMKPGISTIIGILNTSPGRSHSDLRHKHEHEHSPARA